MASRDGGGGHGASEAFSVRRTMMDRDILANLAGRFLSALTGFVFLPLFLRILGAEEYGLVGFYTVLVGMISLFDFGLGLTLNREMARLGQEADGRERRGDTLRTLESVYVLLVVLMGLVVVLGAPAIAGHWLRSAVLPRGTVEQCIRLMGLACGLQLVGAFYQGGLFGLQKQVTANAAMVGFTLMRQAGSLAAMTLAGSRIENYFLAQAAGHLVQVAASRALVRGAIGGLTRKPRFRWEVLRDVRSFALGVSGAAILGAGIGQLDRLVASGFLTLREFAYYSVASSLAGLLQSIIQPLNQVFFPRLARAPGGGPGSFSEVLAQGGRALSALLVPAAAVFAAFSWDAIFFWTSDHEAANAGQLVARILIAGVLLNGLASLPATGLFAAGRSNVMLGVNAVLAVLLVPASLLMTRLWGGAGAAATSILLNFAYLVVLPPLIRREGLGGGWRRWLVYTITVPVVVAGITAFLLRAALPQSQDRVFAGVILSLAGAATATLTWCAMQFSTMIRRRPSGRG